MESPWSVSLEIEREDETDSNQIGNGLTRRHSSMSASLTTTETGPNPANSDCDNISMESIEINSRRPSQVRRVPGALSIDMLGQEEIAQEESLSPLAFYFKIFNYAGLLPYRFSSSFGKIKFLKKLPYTCIQAMLLIHYILHLRKAFQFGIEITGDTRISLYIDLAHLFSNYFLRILFIYTVNFSFTTFSQLLTVIDVSAYKENFATSWNRIFVLGIALSSVLLALLFTMRGIPESPDEEMIIGIKWTTLYFYRYAKGLITSLSVKEAADEIFSTDNLELTGSKVVIGLLENASFFYGYIQDQMVKDLLLVEAFIVWKATTKFKSHFDHGRSQSSNLRNKLFKEVKGISKAVNASITYIYPVFLFDNLLLLAKFYNDSFDPEISRTDKLVLVIDMGKILVFFYLSERIASKLRNLKISLLEDEENHLMSEIDARRTIEEMAIIPLGIGNDTLYIDKGFLISFLGISAAYFLSAVETRGSDENK